MVPIFLWLCCGILAYVPDGIVGGGHRFCSLIVLFCCAPGQPHGSALFVQTLERFAPPVTRGKPGISFFSVVREGVADKPQAPFCVVLAEGAGIALGLDAESGSSWIPAWNYLFCSAHWMGRGLGSQGEPPVLPFWYRNGCE